jgi:ABC-type branched-subunit amino acid transport system substrate-binding protein
MNPEDAKDERFTKTNCLRRLCPPFGFILLACACETKPQEAPSVTAPTPIVIGVSLALTGGLSGSGQILQNATRTAEIEVNAVGGLYGRPVQFRVVDDTSDEGDLVRKTTGGLLAQGALAILGPVGSSQVLAVQEDIANRQVIEITPTATSTDLTTAQPQHDRYLFRTTPADDLQSRAVVLYALKGPNGIGNASGAAACKNMAVIHIDDSYGNGMAKIIDQFFPTKGGNITIDVTVPVLLSPDYKSAVSQVVGANPKPDCQVLIAYADVGDQYMADFKATASGLPAGFFTIGTDGIFTNSFLQHANPTGAIEGISGTNPSTAPQTREYSEFKNLYDALFPETAGDTQDEELKHPFASNQYDAAMLAVLAIEQAGTLNDGVKIRDALFQVSKGGQVFGPSQLGDAVQAIQSGMDIDYKGASGNVDFDDFGNVTADYIIWQVVGGKFKVIGRIPAADLLP